MSRRRHLQTEEKEDDVNWLEDYRQSQYRYLRQRGWWSICHEGQTYWHHDKKIGPIKVPTSEALKYERQLDDQKSYPDMVPSYAPD